MSDNNFRSERIPTVVTVQGELSFVDVARLAYLAGQLGISAQVEADFSHLEFPILSLITDREQYLGYEHFEDFNNTTKFTHRAELSRGFNQCIDAGNSASRSPWRPSSNSVDEAMHTIAHPEGLIVKTRKEVGLEPLPRDERFKTTNNASARRILFHSIVCGQFAIQAGSFVNLYQNSINDRINNLLVSSLANQVKNQLK